MLSRDLAVDSFRRTVSSLTGDLFPFTRLSSVLGVAVLVGRGDCVVVVSPRSRPLRHGDVQENGERSDFSLPCVCVGGFFSGDVVDLFPGFFDSPRGGIYVDHMLVTGVRRTIPT